VSVTSTSVQGAGSPSLHTIWTDRQISLVLFFGVLIIYVAVLRGSLEVYDTKAMMAVTENLVNHGSLRDTGTGFSVSAPWAPHGSSWSPYGLAVSLLAVPFYALSMLTGHFNIIVSLINPLLVAASVVVIYLIARALNWEAVHGLVAAIGFGVLSMVLWYTIELLSEPGVILADLVVILGMVRWRSGRAIAPLWVGIAIACAIQFRTDSVFTVGVAVLAIPLFVPRTVFLSRRSLISLIAPIVVSMVVLFWYNDLRYGKVWVGQYEGVGFNNPLFHGLNGLLLSPGDSLFVFNPLTVLGVIGLILLFVGQTRVRDRALGTVCFLLVVPRILFFAKYGAWNGGSVFGPRFLLPAAAVLTLLIIPVFRATDLRRWSGVLVRLVAVALGLAGGLVAYLSARIPLGEWLGVLASPYWQKVLGIHGVNNGVEFGQALYFNVYTSPIAGYLRLLRRHIAIPSGDLWRHGDEVIGYSLLAVGAALLVAAMIGSRVSRVQPSVAPVLGSEPELRRGAHQKGASARQAVDEQVSERSG